MCSYATVQWLVGSRATVSRAGRSTGLHVVLWLVSCMASKVLASLAALPWSSVRDPCYLDSEARSSLTSSITVHQPTVASQHPQ